MKGWAKHGRAPNRGGTVFWLVVIAYGVWVIITKG